MPGNFHEVPESILATWPKPNYIDPVRRTWMPAFCLVWQIASTIVVTGRIFLRVTKRAGALGLDDAMIFVGWIFSVGFTTTAWLGTEVYGEDRHTWDVPPHLYVGTALVSIIIANLKHRLTENQTGWWAQKMFLFSTVATKLSVLLLYRRLIADTLERRWFYAIYAALFVTTAYCLACFITYCLICQPLNAYWLSYSFTYDKPYTCIDGNALIITSCVLSTLSDFYAVALPYAILRKYDPNISRGQKIALNVMFALGFLVTGTGIGRTIAFWRLNNEYDTSWAGFNLLAWAVAETHLAIICACAPSLRIFFLHYLRGPVQRRYSLYSNSRRTATHQSGTTAVGEESVDRDEGELVGKSERRSKVSCVETCTETGSIVDGRRNTAEEQEIYKMMQLPR